MRAYWFSDRWKQAWGLTLMVALLTALASKASVWMAEASGDLINSIASFHGSDLPVEITAILARVPTDIRPDGPLNTVVPVGERSQR